MRRVDDNPREPLTKTLGILKEGGEDKKGFPEDCSVEESEGGSLNMTDHTRGRLQGG